MFKRLITWFLTKLKNLIPLLSKDKNAPEQTMIKPLFQSSFIQYWYCKDWSLEKWELELSMLKEIGITEIILQNIADTKDKYAVYFTEIDGFKHSDIDMVQTVLTAAEKLKMSVRIGIGFSNDWWKKSSDLAWLNSEMAINKFIIDELVNKYCNYPSFTGWYIPHEFCQITALTKKRQLYLNSFFKQLSAEMKARFPRDIMIAPYYIGKFRCFTPLILWTKILKNILSESNIDILALQDSIGTGYNTIKQLSKIFNYTKKAISNLGIKFYVDVETFTSTALGNRSAPQGRIEKQILLAQLFADGITSFSIDHYQNSNESSLLDGYNEYFNYYLEICKYT